MKKSILILALGLLLISEIKAQDCPLYYPDAINAQLEYKQYDKKGSLTSSSVQKVTDFKRTGNSYVVEVLAETFDAKGKSLGSGKLSAHCEAGIYYIDMKNLLGQSLDAY
jgi:hypothetical protein